MAAEKRLPLVVHVQPDVPAALLGDPVRIRQILFNLAGNAVKFTESGGKITINSSRNDDFVCVTVRNTGMGILPEKLPSLFSRPEQVQRSSGTHRTGRGLFIVKTIVDAHRGTVRAESKQGQGASFIVCLPVRP